MPSRPANRARSAGQVSVFVSVSESGDVFGAAAWPAMMLDSKLGSRASLPPQS